MTLHSFRTTHTGRTQCGSICRGFFITNKRVLVLNSEWHVNTFHTQLDKKLGDQNIVDQIVLADYEGFLAIGDFFGGQYYLSNCSPLYKREAAAGHVPVCVTQQIIRKEMSKIRHHAKIKAKDCESTEEERYGPGMESHDLLLAHEE